jgi:hypothetical protein
VPKVWVHPESPPEWEGTKKKRKDKKMDFRAGPAGIIPAKEVSIQEQEFDTIEYHDVVAEVNQMADELLCREEGTVSLQQKTMQTLKKIQEWEEYCAQLGWKSLWMELPVQDWLAVRRDPTFQQTSTKVAQGRIGTIVVVKSTNASQIVPHSGDELLFAEPYT